MDLDASNGGGGEDDDNDAFFVDDTVFELQASLATMQAEVSQYQKQNQQQQATIRQLQYEISQANLQRQVMQEKLQKQQAPATWPRHHAAPQPVAPPQPPTQQPYQPQQQQHAATTTTNTSVSPSPSKSKPNAATATDSKQATVATSTTTTSLGTFLCRTLLTANTNDNNNNNSKQAKHDHRLVTAVWQKMQPHQDASLLALVVEYSLAYLVVQRQPEQSTGIFLAASQNKTTTTATPLPFLYYSLVFTQGRTLSATDKNDNHNTHRGTCTTTSSTKRPLRLRMVNSAQPPSLPSRKSKDMMIMSSYRIQQTIQAVLQYGIFLLQQQHKQVDDNASKERQEQAQDDLLHVFRLLTLPVANAIEWSDKEDQNDFGPLLWDWITQNLHPHVTAVAVPQAPRRYASCTTTTTTTSERVAAPLEHITAALCLGRVRTSTARSHTHTTQQQSWIRSLVAVSSDWIHFVLLPCFTLYYRPDSSGTRSSPDENDPSTKDTIDDDDDDSAASTRDLDQMSSLACELIQTWQYLFGVDSDWLRTQLALPKKADEAAPSASSLTGRTHATCMLQLACRLLQAIAVEDNVRVRESFGALQACLLRFLGPIVARHAAWLDTSSRLEYTSALARLKAQSSADSLVLACWESAREDPVVMLG